MNLTDSAGLPIDGYMVRGRGLGFVSSTANANTFAHELAHGIGGLQHTWLNNGPAQGSTSNLMDYSNGNNLTKAQWKELRDSEAAASFWDEEVDATSRTGLVANYFWETIMISADPMFGVNDVIQFEINNPTATDNTTNIVPLTVGQIRVIDNNQIDNLGLSNYIAKPTIHFNDEFGHLASSNLHSERLKVLKTNIQSTRYFTKTETNSLKSCIYYRNKATGNTGVIVGGPVVYFEEFRKNTSSPWHKKYIGNSDYVTISNTIINVQAKSHYIVKIFKTAGVVTDYKIYNSESVDVTSSFLPNQTPKPIERIVIFSNGYRGPNFNWLVTDDMISDMDRHDYWTIYDDKFKARLKPTKSYYIDGSERVGTSNAGSMAAMGGSMACVAGHPIHQNTLPCALGSCTLDGYGHLNSTPNVTGFNIRKNHGNIAGKAFLAKLAASDPLGINPKPMVDIVAHSMGYAYAVGFIETVKDYVDFKRFYILSAENACSGGVTWTMFEEVWQYGSNNEVGDPERAPVEKQDGIAPQCGCLGLLPLPQGLTGGRAYIPPLHPKQSFMESHVMTHYWWIFNLNFDEDGYIKPRQ